MIVLCEPLAVIIGSMIYAVIVVLTAALVSVLLEELKVRFQSLMWCLDLRIVANMLVQKVHFRVWYKFPVPAS